jgi:transposase-like protein
MDLRGLSEDQVSRMCRGLDEQVTAFRNRPLEGAYPHLWLDAEIERVREPGGVRQKALVIAYAVDDTGRREALRALPQAGSRRCADRAISCP